MHTGYVKQAEPKNLAEALEQTGHAWWVEQRVAGIQREDVKDHAFMAGFIGGVYNQVFKWADREPALRRFSDRPAVTNYVNGLVERKFNTDISGSTDTLPPNRAEEIQ